MNAATDRLDRDKMKRRQVLGDILLMSSHRDSISAPYAAAGDGGRRVSWPDWFRAGRSSSQSANAARVRSAVVYEELFTQGATVASLPSARGGIINVERTTPCQVQLD